MMISVNHVGFPSCCFKGNKRKGRRPPVATGEEEEEDGSAGEDVSKPRPQNFLAPWEDFLLSKA
jgi:hypothetical protein